MQIILASSSPFRHALLQRLGLAFESEAPELDETRLTDESPEAMVRRLSQVKASRIAARHPNVLVIGSDQCAALDDSVLGKPGDHNHATMQLSLCSGREVKFYTGLCLIRDSVEYTHLDTTLVRFRRLSAPEIQRYLQVEQPYGSAGSFKVEGLGISLFESIQSDDPTALIGLPLIALCHLLRQAGLSLP